MAEGTSANVDDDDLFDFSASVFAGGLSQFPRDSTRRIPESNVCRFFIRGRCKFGDSCWNSHTLVKHDASSKFNQRCDRSSAGPSRQSSENREINPPKLDMHKNHSHETKHGFLVNTTAQNEESKTNQSGQHPPDWVNAPEFVPKTVRSYADTLKCNINYMNEPQKVPSMELCSYFVDGDCPFEEQCPYVHGDICELCGKACLNPYDDKQRQMHTEFCEKELEQDMELSFAIQRSLDKSCGICMDVIMEKEPISERRFGILEKCNHVFCLTCIRKWRKVKTFENSNHIDNALDPVVTRACPECRVSSDFITPSQYWVDTEDEKQKLISDYKIALSKKPCKYFKQGKGTCPFGGACFYLHAKPDGTKVELPPPVRRRRQNQDGELDFMGRIFLWDYLELRDNDILMQLDLDDFMFSISDSDDDTSEASDNFFLSESF
ncbi:probable E3 ubiquitin-protein ligase makorin-1 [Argiope bruennichi]|uniref:probable E3 ubiquitin-protein ligase makorin-1 n=1 Tax=Argiope bruennichi TaxID=94029 RepID=UPI00249533EC|nr:probable E3 ubiquitin-protein ligase makorin-1 [Argiope bruennichi]